MERLLGVCFRATGSLFIPGMPMVIIQSIILTVLVLAAMVISMTGLAMFFYQDSDAVPVVAGAISVSLAWLLFPGITPLIVSFFDQRISALVEAQAYPGLTPRPTAAFWPEFRQDMRFALKSVLLNVLALPLYFVPILNLVLYYWLNGKLLGREYFVMVARRHVPTEEAEAMRRKHGRLLTLAGAVLTLMTTLPFINLVAPLWGVALMVHLFHALPPAQAAAKQPQNQPNILL